MRANEAGMTLAEPTQLSDQYQRFLSKKLQESSRAGFKPLWLPSSLFDFQASVAEWNIETGKSADFIECGLGKSWIELVWAENVVRHTNKPVLLLDMLGVTKQMIGEADKVGVEARRSAGDLGAGAAIIVTNYEKLHHFSPHDFGGVVCDESSAIKAMAGKRREQVTEFLRTVPYRLLATATPAPNDFIELGTSSEALGVMGQIDMLNRFFKNDNNTSDIKMMRRRAISLGGPVSAGWRFKGHAEGPFWRWVPSWARAGRRPSDFGDFDDSAFVLPPLIEREHIVETRTLAPGMLIPMPATNMQEEREERRRTIVERCEKAAQLVKDTGQPFVIWCELNPEGDLLEKLIPDAVQVAGSDDDEAKEAAYDAFGSGQVRGLISKQSVAGWGLNWQHCPHVVEFASHSFEKHWQGVRRCWRFGQKQTVVNDIIATEGQRGIKENQQRKAVQADRMFAQLVANMNASQVIDTSYKFEKEENFPSWL